MTAVLPWDEYQPDEPAPLPEPEPEPPEPPDQVHPPEPGPGLPEPPADWAIEAALEDLWPAIKEKAAGYVRDSWEGIREGQTVDVLHPTIEAETAAGKKLVIADAKSRSVRTLIQGLIFDVFAGIVAAVAFLSGADPFQKETWIAFGVLLLKSVVSAIISYFMRLKVQPTIKTPGQRMAVMPVPTRIDEEQQS